MGSALERIIVVENSGVMLVLVLFIVTMSELLIRLKWSMRIVTRAHTNT